MEEKDPEDPGAGLVPTYAEASEEELVNGLEDGLAADGRVLCWNCWEGKTWDADP